MKKFIGIDIGSTNAKIAMVDENDNLIKTLVKKTGFSSKDTANILIKEILDDKIFDSEEDKNDIKIVATGYGRVSVENATKEVTEITCHAKGATYIFKDDNIVIIDIGGQDTKIIDVERGIVKDFVMNDKCSAGTGRFLEVMAKTMEISIEELCELARLGSGVTISSLCTVFAESEVISLIGKSEKKENIANAVLMSIINKVSAQTKKLNLQNKNIYLTGGLSEMSFVVESLSKALNANVKSDKLGKFAGAIGAALMAKNIKD